jgi:hypothetical protein
MLGCAFKLLEKCARSCWACVGSAIPQLMEDALQIFQRRLFPDALSFIEHCLGTWASERRYSTGPQEATDDSTFGAEETAFVGTIAAGAAAAVAAAMHSESTLAFPDASAAIAAFFDMIKKLLDLSPRVVFQPEIFGVAVVAVGQCASFWDRSCAKAASSMLQRVFMHVEIMTAYAEQIQACMTEHGSTLMSQLFQAVLDDRSTATVATSMTEIVRILLECYGDKGAQDAMSAALELHASAIEGAEADRLELLPSDLPMILETGILSLSPEDRTAITALCARYAATDRRRFNMLFSDLIKVCKGLTLKDSLLSHIIAASDHGGKKTYRSNRRLLEEAESLGEIVNLA